jgi:serine protease Do
MLDFPARTRETGSCRSVALATVALNLIFWTGHLHAQVDLANLQPEVQRVFDQSKGAVVRINAEDEHGRLAGTGFFVDPNGTVYTSYTIGGETHDIVVEFGSNRYPAHRLVSDRRSNLAILKVAASTPWLPLSSAAEPKIATPVVTVGYPMDLPATPNFGIVGGIDKKYLDRYFPTALIRANLTIQRGEIGSPLIDLKGEVVGIILSTIGDRTACFALPMRAAEKVHNDYVRFGEIRPGWIGAATEDSGSPQHDSTAMIKEVAPGSPAETAGLEIGDIVLQIGARIIHEAPDVPDASFFITAQEDVPVTVFRDGKAFTIIVTAADHPDYSVQRAPLIAPSQPANRENNLQNSLHLEE